MSAPAVSALIEVMRRQAEALDELRYRHEVLTLVMGSGDLSWLAVAADELEAAERRLAEIDLERAVRAAELARTVGVAESAPLREVLVRLDDPAPELERLAEVMRRTGREIDERRELTSEVAGRQLDLVRQRIDRIEANMDPITYGPSAASPPGSTSVRL